MKLWEPNDVFDNLGAFFEDAMNRAGIMPDELERLRELSHGVSQLRGFMVAVRGVAAGRMGDTTELALVRHFVDTFRHAELSKEALSMCATQVQNIARQMNDVRNKNTVLELRNRMARSEGYAQGWDDCKAALAEEKRLEIEHAKIIHDAHRPALRVVDTEASDA